jgi:two-component system, NarL family, sensor kinase
VTGRAQDPRPSWRQRLGTSGSRELLLFVGVTLIMFVAVSAGSVVASEHLARRDALEEAERTTVRIADLLIGPSIEEYLGGAPASRAALDDAVANRLRDESLHSLIVWDAEGRAVYASDAELSGQRSEPSGELRSALSGDVVAELSEGSETAYDTGDAYGPLLEVYAPIRSSSVPLVLELYFDYELIEQQADRLLKDILPVALGGLALLQIVQIPIAASLTARVRRHEAERGALVARNLAESERERRLIAADLHDGPVQDLAGVSYALSALRSSVPAARQPTVDRLLDAVRRAVASLRQVMIDVYPPELSGEGLAEAVRGLTERLADQGIDVHLDINPLPPVDPDQAAALYRTAKESLANIVHHAEATQTWVSLAALNGGPPPHVRLVVADDGVGFPPDRIGRSPEGHLGLDLMIGRLHELGGRVQFGTRPGGGAIVTAELPVDRAE